MFTEQTETVQDLLNIELKEKLVFVMLSCKTSGTFLSFIQCLWCISRIIFSLYKAVSESLKTEKHLQSPVVCSKS